MKKIKNLKIRFDKISTRIILGILLCSIILSTIVGGIALIESQKYISDEATDKLRYMAESYQQEFSGELRRVELVADNLEYIITAQLNVSEIDSNEEYLEGFEEDIAPLVEKIAQDSSSAKSAYIYFNPELTGEAHDIYYIDHDGDGIVTKQEETPAEYYDTRPEDGSMEWWFKPIEENKGIWTDPYEWTFGNGSSEIFLSYTKPVFIDEKLIAVVGTDFLFSQITEIINSHQVYDTGYAYLMNDKFDFLLHPTYEGENIEKVENGNLAFVKKDIQKGEDIVNYDINDKKHISSISQLSNGWYIGITSPIDEVFAKSRALSNIILVIMAIGAVIAGIFAYFIGKVISNPLKESFNHIQVIGTGDFTKEISGKLLKKQNEIGQLANSIKQMQDNIKELIHKTKKASNEVKSTSQVVSEASEQSSISIEEVSKAIEEIAVGATEQAKDTTIAADIVMDFNKLFEDIIKDNSEIVEYSTTVKEENKKGIDLIKELEDKNKFTNGSVSQIEDATLSLNDKIKNIDKILETIDSISEQTNLLSLNASIEAARAGDQGKGFAVVANEIRNLAIQSSSSTEDIKEIIKEIHKESENTIDIMGEVKVNTKDQTMSVQNVNTSFTQLLNSLEEIINKINQLSVSVKETGEMKEKLVDVVDNISSISQQTAASSEEVSASVEEQTAAVEEIASLAKNLNKLSNNLQFEIDKFNI